MSALIDRFAASLLRTPVRGRPENDAAGGAAQERRRIGIGERRRRALVNFRAAEIEDLHLGTGRDLDACRSSGRTLPRHRDKLGPWWESNYDVGVPPAFGFVGQSF